MSDPIAGKIAEQAANQAAQQGASQPQAQVDAKDQARFEDALNQPNDAQATQPANHPTEVAPPEAAESTPRTLGDAILDGLERAKSNYDSHVNNIQQGLMEKNGQPMTTEEAMRLQFEIMQMNIEQDVTGKIADKTNQGVQTLFRPQ